MNTRVFITGGCGYVGSRVAQSLATTADVTVVDIIAPSERGVIFSDTIEFRQADLRDPSAALMALKGADVVVHLAADIGPLTYMHEHQADIVTNNGALDASVYPAALANNVQWMVYSSSSMVFQGARKYPYTESDIHDVRLPDNIYGFSKLSGEYFCKAYASQYGMPYTILRYHNIYGPGEDSKGSTPGDIHVIPALIEKVIKGQFPLEFLGDPASTRPFTYIDDAVEATVRTIQYAMQGDHRIRNEDFNVGNDRFYSILELGNIIWDMFGDGRKFEYIVKNTVANTASRREVDISKIRTILGWQPEVTLEQGLRATAEWMRGRDQKSV